MGNSRRRRAGQNVQRPGGAELDLDRLTGARVFAPGGLEQPALP